MLPKTGFVDALQSKRLRRFCVGITIVATLGWTDEVGAQSAPGLLVSRAELTAIAARADSLAVKGDESARVRNAMFAASVHQRLRDGDFQIGDRIVVTVVSDVVRKDTVAVKPGRVLQLADNVVVPVTGVLRSELRERVASEVLKLVKARQIEVTPLMRVAVLGEVARPGYFAFASDIPITDAIMGAGGPTGGADLQKSVVRRGNKPYRSSDETRKAIAGGLTLDQFGLNAGDELVIGRRSSGSGALLGMVGTVGSVAALVLALRH